MNRKFWPILVGIILVLALAAAALLGHPRPAAPTDTLAPALAPSRRTSPANQPSRLDQSSLLIAMLRGSGIPARYRHGTLITETAQSLILSMSPEPEGVIGYIPAGTEVADPANDPQLLAETVDHWWVEAYVPGVGWTDFDPCFVNAQPGQGFYETLSSDGTDRIAEVSSTTR